MPHEERRRALVEIGPHSALSRPIEQIPTELDVTKDRV